ncbi:MAG: OsmC family protein [Pirellulaceae bacterium]|nr:OsmC family protein [Pirellulaceae bacterium]
MTTKTHVTCVNGIDLNVLEETVEAMRNEPELGRCKFRARNKWRGGTQNRTTIAEFHAANRENSHQHDFEMDADEPPMLAGEDEGANPVEHLLNALAGCATTSMVAHAAVRGIHIDELESELEGDLDLNGFLGLDPTVPKGYTNIRVKFRVKTDEANLNKLKSLAQLSPVYNTLTNGVKVDIQIEPK